MKEAPQTGEFGYPMMNVQATIIEAKFDPQLSTEDDFVRAAVEAYRDATRGNVQLLEPIMRVRVTTPNEFLGNVIGDLSSRGGQIDEGISVERSAGLGALEAVTYVATALSVTHLA